MSCIDVGDGKNIDACGEDRKEKEKDMIFWYLLPVVTFIIGIIIGYIVTENGWRSGPNLDDHKLILSRRQFFVVRSGYKLDD